MGLISDLLLPSLAWKLTSLDSGQVIEGQFIPQELTENVSSEYSTSQTFNRGAPFVHFTGQGARTISFKARVLAKHQGLFGLLQDEVEDLVTNIRSTCRVNPILLRPEIYLFEAGQYLKMKCVVRTVGGIVYDRMRPLDGSLRGITCSFDLLEFVDYTAEASDAINESLVVPILEDDTYELIASRHYGDPRVGEALRRRNPAKPTPIAGELIHIPPKDSLLRGFSLTPQTDCLKSNKIRAQAALSRGL